MRVVRVSFTPMFASCWSSRLTHAKKVLMRVRMRAMLRTVLGSKVPSEFVLDQDQKIKIKSMLDQAEKR
jgi:hypothetical protein